MWLVRTSAEVYIEAQQDRTLSDGRCPFTGSTTTPSDLDTASSSSGSKRPGLSVSLPYRDYLPFKDEPYQIDLKFDRISRNAIFEIDEHHEADMARKAHILATRPPELVLPGVAGVSAQ